MRLGRLLARLVIGGLFIGHGTQKLFGWFGGPGLDGTEQMMGKLRMHPPRANAMTAGLTETTSGAMLAAGLFTPLAAAGIIGTMVTAIRQVHGPNGPWNSKGGYEYNLVIIAALLGLVDGGPGALSLDRALGIHDTGAGWALAALATGAAASAVAVELGQRTAADTESGAGQAASKDGQRADQPAPSQA